MEESMTAENEKTGEPDDQDFEDAPAPLPDQAPDAEVCLDEQEAPTVTSVVEAVLFASDEPLSEGRLAHIVETTTKQVRQCVTDLNERYKTNRNAFRIEPIAGGYQMLTLSSYNHWLRKLLSARSDTKLSARDKALVAFRQRVVYVV